MGELINEFMCSHCRVCGCLYSIGLSGLSMFCQGALGKCESLLNFVEFTKKLWHEGGV